MQVLEKVDESKGLLARKLKSFINYFMGAFKFIKPIFIPISLKPLKVVASTIQNYDLFGGPSNIASNNIQTYLHTPISNQMHVYKIRLTLVNF